MNVEFYDVDVHLIGFGKSDGFALHSLEMGAKVEVFSFDALGAVFSDVMFGGGQGFFVAFPRIGKVAFDLARGQFAQEF